MSFWNNPGESLKGLTSDPWHSMENFGTTGLVPLIPYIGGIVGGIYGGPAGAAAGGAAGQAGVDYFSGNSDAKTGEGIMGSLFSGAGKGSLASGGYNSAGGADGIMGMFGGGDTSGGFGIGKGANYTDFTNTSGGSFGNLNSTPSSSGSDFGFNFGSPSSIASSNSAMGLSDLSAPSSMSNFGQSLAKQLLSQKQGGQQGGQSAYQYHDQPVQRQAAFAPTPAPFQVQDKPTDIAALVAALRSKGSI